MDGGLIANIADFMAPEWSLCAGEKSISVYSNNY